MEVQIIGIDKKLLLIQQVNFFMNINNLKLIENIIKRLNEIDFVLHIGDISYAVGDSSEWDEFMNQITPIAQKVPYMTCIGNHERDFPNSGILIYRKY